MKLANFLTEALSTDTTDSHPFYHPLCDEVLRVGVPLLLKLDMPRPIALAILTGITLVLHKLLEQRIPEDLEAIAHDEGGVDTFDIIQTESQAKAKTNEEDLLC